MSLRTASNWLFKAVWSINFLRSCTQSCSPTSSNRVCQRRRDDYDCKDPEILRGSSESGNFGAIGTILYLPCYFKHVSTPLYKHFAILKDSRALLLTFDNGSKTKASDDNWSASLNKFIDNLAETVAVLNRDNLLAEKPTIPPLTTFLIYKAAAITTRKLQADVEPEVNLQRLRVLRNALKIINQRWLAGGKNTYWTLLINTKAFRTVFKFARWRHNPTRFECC